VAVQTLFTPILKAKSISTKLNYRGGFEKGISVKHKSWVKSKA
jgi:hypothetical protein